jgi:hypothetical protein
MRPNRIQTITGEKSTKSPQLALATTRAPRWPTTAARRTCTWPSSPSRPSATTRCVSGCVLVFVGIAGFGARVCPMHTCCDLATPWSVIHSAPLRRHPAPAARSVRAPILGARGMRAGCAAARGLRRFAPVPRVRRAASAPVCRARRAGGADRAGGVSGGRCARLHASWVTAGDVGRWLRP